MHKNSKKEYLTITVFTVYMILLVWLILFKFSTSIEQLPHIRNINLIPYGASMVVNGKIQFTEIIYNVIVFIPLGVYVAMREDFSFFRKCLVGFFVSLLFEVMQYVFAIGASDITDVIDNTLGGVLGILLFLLLKKIFKKHTVTIVNIIGMVIEIAAIILITVILLANS